MRKALDGVFVRRFLFYPFILLSTYVIRAFAIIITPCCYVAGQRVKKWNSSSAVYYPNAFYEVETGNGSVVASQVEAEGVSEDFAPDAVASDAKPLYLPLVAQSGTVAGLQGDDTDVSAASLTNNVVKYYFPSVHSGQALVGKGWR